MNKQEQLHYITVEELVKDTSSKKMIITKIAVEWWLMGIKSFQINLKILLYFFMISLLYLLKIFLKMQWKFTNIEQWNHFLNIPLLHLYLICSWYLFHQGLLLGSVKLKRVIYGESTWFFHIKKIMRLFLFCEFLINQFIFWQVFLISTFPFFCCQDVLCSSLCQWKCFWERAIYLGWKKKMVKLFAGGQKRLPVTRLLNWLKIVLYLHNHGICAFAQSNINVLHMKTAELNARRLPIWHSLKHLVRKKFAINPWVMVQLHQFPCLKVLLGRKRKSLTPTPFVPSPQLVMSQIRMN